MGNEIFIEWGQDNLDPTSNLVNRVSAKYILYGVENSEYSTEIHVKQYGNSDKFVDIRPRVFGVSKHDIDINIMYRGNSDIFTEIQPYGHTNFETEIEVRPHSRMWALYEVQQPPIVSDTNNPIMDAFVRSEGVFATINNGSGISMVVGKQNNEVWDSYIKFDLSHISSSLPILSSKLKLYYTGSLSQLDLELFEISDVWGEYSVTYLNSPEIGRLIATNYVQNISQRYIEFDVSAIVLEWLSNPTKNLGFYLKASNLSSDGQMIFRTRESMQPPELIVDHYSTSVFSTGRSDALTEIVAMKADKSDKNSEIEVSSAFAFSRMETEIYCHRPEVPIDTDIEVEITSNKIYEYAELTVSIVEESDKNAQIDVMSQILTSRVDSEITINKPFSYVEIYSANINEKAVEITVSNDRVYSEISVSNPFVLTEVSSRVADYSNTDIIITVSNDAILTEIDVLVFSDIETEINIIGLNYSDALTEINVSNYIVEAEVTVRLTGQIDYYTEITANRPFAYVEIRTPEQSNMETEIDVLPNSSKHSEITVSRDTALVEIITRAYDESDVNAELYVKYVSHVELEITAKSVSQIPVSIDVKITSNVESVITVSNDRLFVEITPRVEGKSEMFVELLPRISTVDNVEVTLTVGGGKKAYGFVM